MKQVFESCVLKTRWRGVKATGDDLRAKRERWRGEKCGGRHVESEDRKLARASAEVLK